MFSLYGLLDSSCELLFIDQIHVENSGMWAFLEAEAKNHLISESEELTNIVAYRLKSNQTPA